VSTLFAAERYAALSTVDVDLRLRGTVEEFTECDARLDVFALREA
jgi:hypothetical protein